MSIRVLIVDDHALMRAGLKALLGTQPDIQVVGQAASGIEAVRSAAELEPDIVLMDISMAGLDGVQATQKIKSMTPNVKIIALTMHEDESVVRGVLKAGASGYVLKRGAEDELLVAIRAVHRGEAFIPPSLTRSFINDYLDAAPDSDTSNEPEIPLTPRELEVLSLIARGYKNQEIAEELVISVKTVETHKANIKEKLGIRAQADLVRYALRKGLLVM
ncbi:MAG: DNA-binding response regulator [Chloroflexi bacterium]|nr:MAG: DNA-binding response regulator [Chloroflexota bacterium]